MILIPYESLIIESPLPVEEARQRLNNVVAPRRSFLSRLSEYKPYHGKIEGYRFTVTRIIHYRNPSQPIVKGEIRPGAAGCSVHITMAPHVLVLLLVLPWLASGVFVLLAALGSLVSPAIAALSGMQQPSSLIGPIVQAAFPALIYAMVYGGFKFEAVKSKRFFNELFQEDYRLI